MDPLSVIAITIEAGDWPPEDDLRALCEQASGAVMRVLPPPLRGRERVGGRPSPLPGPPPQGGREGVGRELSVLFTDDAAVRRLNATWRGKDLPTNVLSFPQPDGPLLGDIVLAGETVWREAGLAGKTIEEHIAHLIVHGFLHLLGYDHEDEGEADEMEHLETAAMAEMGLADPYRPSRQDR